MVEELVLELPLVSPPPPPFPAMVVVVVKVVVETPFTFDDLPANDVLVVALVVVAVVFEA